MKSACIEVVLPHHSYQVQIEPGILSRLGTILRGLVPAKKCAVFSDESVAALYQTPVAGTLRGAGYEVLTADFKGGEEYKSLQSVSTFYEALLSQKFERTNPVIGLGGGVVGDTVGFVAATYLRGVPFVQAPTSLLAMVDASVGGKVGVNVPQGKNLIGAFYQPNLVAIDPETLTTLPPRELTCGLAECVKHGLLADAELFEWIADHSAKIRSLEMSTMVELIARNVQVKADIVSADEKEQGRRALLNLGHTFGHAIEKTSNYAVQHGEAVALGIVAACEVSCILGRISRDVQSRIEDLISSVGLPKSYALASPETLLEAMKLDKKVKDSKIRLVLLNAIGAAEVVNDVSEEIILAGFERIRA